MQHVVKAKTVGSTSCMLIGRIATFQILDKICNRTFDIGSIASGNVAACVEFLILFEITSDFRNSDIPVFFLDAQLHDNVINAVLGLLHNTEDSMDLLFEMRTGYIAGFLFVCLFVLALSDRQKQCSR